MLLVEPRLDEPAPARPRALRGRVLHVCTIDVTAWFLLRRQLHALREAGYDVELACAPGRFTERLAAEGVPVHAVPLRRAADPIALARSTFALTRLMRRRRYDAVHVHSPLASLAGRLAAALARLPHVFYTCHGFCFHERHSRARRWLWAAIEMAQSPLTDVVLQQSEEDRQTALRMRIFPAWKQRTISNGVDTEHFAGSGGRAPVWRHQVRARLGLGPERRVVGTIGRMVEEKGFRDLALAASLVVDAVPDAAFLVVGDQLESDRDPFRTEFERILERNGTHERFRFTGFVDDTAPYLHAMDLFVLPSYREGMPRSVLEAMASGLPVVATDIRGCREEVVDGVTGLLVPPGDPARLGAASVALLSDGDRSRRMGAAGQQRAREQFDESQVCARVLEEYERRLGR